jgi:hypothetical protein
MTTQKSGLKQGAVLNGVTRDQLNALNPAIVHYIGHLHVATAGFIAGTGIAVAALSWSWRWRLHCPTTTRAPFSSIG